MGDYRKDILILIRSIKWKEKQKCIPMGIRETVPVAILQIAETDHREAWTVQSCSSENTTGQELEEMVVSSEESVNRPSKPVITILSGLNLADWS